MCGGFNFCITSLEILLLFVKKLALPTKVIDISYAAQSSAGKSSQLHYCLIMRYLLLTAFACATALATGPEARHDLSFPHRGRLSRRAPPNPKAADHSIEMLFADEDLRQTGRTLHNAVFGMSAPAAHHHLQRPDVNEALIDHYSRQDPYLPDTFHSCSGSRLLLTPVRHSLPLLQQVFHRPFLRSCCH